MELKMIGTALAAAALFSGCSMFQRGPAKGSPEASTQLLQSGENDVVKAESNYKDAVLKYGESSNEAVKAKTAWNDAKNKYAANQMHVQQLQRYEAQPKPIADPTVPTSGNMYPPQQ